MGKWIIIDGRKRLRFKSKYGAIRKKANKIFKIFNEGYKELEDLYTDSLKKIGELESKCIENDKRFEKMQSLFSRNCSMNRIYRNENRILRNEVQFLKLKSQFDYGPETSFVNEGENLKLRFGRVEIGGKFKIENKNDGYCYLCLENKKDVIDFSCKHGLCSECLINNYGKKVKNAYIVEKCLVCNKLINN
jgi:hypothetical protein